MPKGFYIMFRTKADYEKHIARIQEMAMQQVLDVCAWVHVEDMRMRPERNVLFHDSFEKRWKEYKAVCREDLKDDPKELAYMKAWLDARVKAAYPAGKFEEYEERYSR